MNASPSRSDGLRWAWVMMALQLLEILVLVEVVFFDRDASGVGSGSGMIEIYFAIVVVTAILQALGILLVRRGNYRYGAVLQLVSSAVHLIKGEGIIGIIGGLRAWEFDRHPVTA